ncbi:MULTISPECIES: GlsB/YeaQ/YmgE family stress response membrane protein [Exiguobacterium]|jgi:uncharacterized membrane protein YeaQ/YmgE (transglycosylase-associated protein family)|uniref:Transglycosylase-associated protein n=1 Tax=Exiguobacterium sibiricum (strain DSM 17290 / CCUG 55495 / CIP 109462 / JCM 13490 / 255-15) TaxID=262543 RepID=B1YKJ0_EXIS2|nr:MULTISPECIES: GlsB/YeaQ/YmgE family stress response membrane protein [Exiguobacterium]ACB60173.1 Transglycosylase-associated protein [Exiguobacterium sibiricum 255-15]MCK2158140.1 GlsB/YeaQ/YmgE family stress response membrane protein [Exiguobacterium sp. 17-1]MDX1259688.1 GlsB/YeaQ/YmgE family stress response membrane protein [Exiguobacterium sp. K1]QNR20324.1 GlsB/YeaQ/YmgE family stress response membrane protein [Exiguobacterium sp. Helios]RDB34913.1 GlsB/YeaQ/YmgE family stress response
MGFLWALIVGGIIGWLASLILGKDVPGGVIGNIIAGFVGSMIGQALFGSWGPSVAGFAIVPAILGAIILILIVSFILRAVNKR